MVTFVNLANFLTFKYQKFSANWTPMNNYYFRIENQIFEIKIRKVGFIVLIKLTLCDCKSEYFKMKEYLIQFFLVLRIRSFELPKGHLRHFK